MQMQQAQELQQRQIQQSLEELRQSTQTHQQNSVQMHQQGHEVMAAQQQQIQQLAAQQASGPIAPLPEKFPEQARCGVQEQRASGSGSGGNASTPYRPFIA
ncbi:unnamed protein product, partial [Prorocentrum cordatum]